MSAEEKENDLDNHSLAVPSPLHENDKTSNAIHQWWHIDREMLRFKIHYFLFESALGASLPFLVVLAKNRIGLSATSLAAILTTQQFLFIFTKPLIGYLADYFNKLKAIICMVTVIATVFLFLLLAIPKINQFQPDENNLQNNFVLTLDAYNETCVLHKERETSSVNQFQDDMVCSTLPEMLEFQYKCSKISIYKSNAALFTLIGINSTNNVHYRMNSSDGINDIESSNKSFQSICASCCNNTNDCHIVSCIQQKNYSSTETSQELSQFESYQFWLFAFELTLVQASINALFTLSDTACCESIAKTGADMGRQRLFGALGWGLLSPIGGILNDYTDDFLPGWIITGVFLTMSLWNLWKLDLVQPQFSQNILKDVGTVLKSKDFLIFEMGVLLNGMGIGIIWFYQIWFLTTIGASRFLCGLVQTLQCFAGEIPFMFYSGWFIKKLGHCNVLTFSLMAYSIRFFWYSYLENPWLVLPMECVHGISYGIFYPAVSSYAKLSSKPGTEATTQSILFSTHEGLGAGLGCVLAGIGFDSFGAHETFFYASIFAGCGMIFNLTFTLWNRKHKKSITVTSSVTEL